MLIKTLISLAIGVLTYAVILGIMLIQMMKRCVESCDWTRVVEIYHTENEWKKVWDICAKEFNWDAVTDSYLEKAWSNAYLYSGALTFVISMVTFII